MQFMAGTITEARQDAWRAGEYRVPQEPLLRTGLTSFQDLYKISKDHSFGRREGGYHTGRPLLVACIEDAIPTLSYQLRPFDIIRTAGAGVLDTSTTIGQLRSQLEARREGGNTPEIAGARSHPWCGAVDLQKRRTGNNEDATKVGLDAAAEVNAGIGGSSAQSISYVNRGEDLHPARVVYYDATYAGLDPTRMVDMPKGFVVSRGWMGQEIGMRDAELAAQIAFGEHGFGPLFTEATPLWVIGITDNDPRSLHHDQLGDELDQVRWNVRRTVFEDSTDEGSRIASDMIIAPGIGR